MNGFYSAESLAVRDCSAAAQMRAVFDRDRAARYLASEESAKFQRLATRSSGLHERLDATRERVARAFEPSRHALQALESSRHTLEQALRPHREMQQLIQRERAESILRQRQYAAPRIESFTITKLDIWGKAN